MKGVSATKRSKLRTIVQAIVKGCKMKSSILSMGLNGEKRSSGLSAWNWLQTCIRSTEM
jgi:hypothetical protein